MKPNQQNKEASKIQPETLKKEQSDSNLRGRERGIIRGNGGHQGTCMKDTWTKPKGVDSRVERGDGGGGMAGCK